MPRKIIYNEQIKNRICEALEKGHFVKDACKLANIGTSTFYDWYNAGKDGDERFTDFSDAVDIAEAKALDSALTTIRKAASEDWKADAWFLERRSQDWQKKEKLEMSGSDSKPIEIVVKWPESVDSDEEGD